MKQRFVKNHLTVRCIKEKKGCKFRARLNFRNVSDCELPEFFELDNFIVLAGRNMGRFTPHTCMTGTTSQPPILDSFSAYTRYRDTIGTLPYLSQVRYQVL